MKLRLKVLSGSLAGRTFELESGFLTIGRGENCSVRFDPTGERVASKQHAFIEGRADGFHLTDNQSTNGTFVNGQRVQAVKLSGGDKIQFGKNGSEASVEIEQAAASQPDQFRQEQISTFDHLAAKVPEGNVGRSVANIGLGNIGSVAAAPPSKTKTYVGAGLAIFAIVFLSIIVGLLMFMSVGPIPAVLATVIAFTPAFLYLFPFLALDRYDPEPFWLLAMAFAWGALVAVIVSFIFNTIFGAVVYAGVGNEGAASYLSAVISAPIVEEGSKGVGLLILLLFFRRYFDDILDGIVYAGVIALGFATVENVLYYGNGLNRAFAEMMHGQEAGTAFAGFLFLFALRGILSPWAHVTFTAMTGIGCGIARESHRSFVRFAMPIIGYLAAVMLHAIWNGLSPFVTYFLVEAGFAPVCESIGLGGQGLGLCGFLTFYTFLEIPLFLAFLIFSFFIMRRQRKILSEMLALDVARGLIPQEHFSKALSGFKSSSWLLNGLFNGKFGARSRYLRAIGKLGLSYWHIQRATAAQGQTGSFQQNPILREEVLKWRDQV